MKTQLENSDFELQSVKRQLHASNIELTIANNERMSQEASLKAMKARVDDAEERQP